MIERVVDGGVSAEEDCADPADLKRCILRSRRRTTWCEFSARLLALNARSCQALRPRSRNAATYEPSLSVTITVGTLQQFPYQLQRRALVAPALHQKIENLALVVDHAPEVHLLATDPDHHLVEMPT
jgi:hypothetical protein